MNGFIINWLGHSREECPARETIDAGILTEWAVVSDFQRLVEVWVQRTGFEKWCSLVRCLFGQNALEMAQWVDCHPNS